LTAAPAVSPKLLASAPSSSKPSTSASSPTASQLYTPHRHPQCIQTIAEAPWPHRFLTTVARAFRHHSPQISEFRPDFRPVSTRTTLPTLPSCCAPNAAAAARRPPPSAETESAPRCPTGVLPHQELRESESLLVEAVHRHRAAAGITGTGTSGTRLEERRTSGSASSVSGRSFSGNCAKAPGARPIAGCGSAAPSSDLVALGYRRQLERRDGRVGWPPSGGTPYPAARTDTPDRGSVGGRLHRARAPRRNPEPPLFDSLERRRNHRGKALVQGLRTSPSGWRCSHSSPSRFFAGGVTWLDLSAL